jgi:hypothetical protein
MMGAEAAAAGWVEQLEVLSQFPARLEGSEAWDALLLLMVAVWEAW